MNSTLTYQCPNCSAGLVFDAEKQSFACDFCLSEFTEAELAESRAAERAEKKAREETEFSEGVNAYYCSSCGAQIIAEKNTAADMCYYCHNPIVLTDKVQGALRPSKIIPFKMSKEEAEEHFISFAKSKWFVPNDYFSKDTAEKICGVYYPFWVTDADTDAALNATGKTVRTWRSGDYRYTETNTYAVHRRGRIHFEDIATSAISTEDKAMLEGILPYPTDAYVDFSIPYLQGFVAKSRDIEQADLGGEVKRRMNNYAEELLKRTATGYSSVTTNSVDVAILNAHWEYSLMPIWLLTYKKNDKTYIYAMNGATGKMYGELPVSIPKLIALGVGVFLLSFLAAFGLGWLIFAP